VNACPKELFLTKGVGYHKHKLASFEEALRNAQIARFNLVVVSSIIPPGCRVITKEKGLGKLESGEIVYVVMSREATDEGRRLLAASVGIAIPRDRRMYGYLSEYHSFGEKEELAGDTAEDLAASMLATTLGVDFDPDTAWDERKELWKLGGKIVRTSNVTQSAIGRKNGIWTTVLAAAVFAS
jgi:arginine decarboxylase